jgi:plastocyanin
MKKSFFLLLLTALVSCQGQPSDTTMPSMADHSFTPVEVGVGETVKWVNDTDEAHTVTAVEDGLPEGADFFSSGGASSEEEAKDDLANELIQPGESFEWTFDEPGTYRYYCIPHLPDGMKGTVIVE